MITLLRAHGLRVIVFTDDHEPAHVHVFGDGHAKINLVGPDGLPELVWCQGMTKAEDRTAINLVREHQAMLVQRWREFMADRDDFEAAAARGRELGLREPRAKTARYDRRLKRVIVELTSGASFTFPPAIVEGLEAANDSQLSGVEILGDGYGLHWEALDVDYTVPGLLAGVFGTRSYLARQAGRVTSAAKAKAARANGGKGGRPRKLAAG